MSTRTVNERELLLELAHKVDELAAAVVGLHLRTERLGVIMDADAALASRRVAVRCNQDHVHTTVDDARDCNRRALELDHTPDTVGRLRDYLGHVGRVSGGAA